MSNRSDIDDRADSNLNTNSQQPKQSNGSVWVGEADFSVADEYRATCDLAPHAGAVVFFVGLVRDFYADKAADESVDYIELQHYPGMTESLCSEIVDQAHQRYPFEYARVLHRVGKLYAGDQIVMVAVAAQHRENAFQAAQFIMDFLKNRATFWKKEVGSRGQQWLGVKDKDKKALKRWQ